MVDKHKCIKCQGQCCRTIGVEIETPTTKEDFRFLKWYLFHEGIEVYKDKHNTWNLEISTKCKHLGKDHLCKIYEERPNICRDFSEKECENEENLKILFQDPEDVDEFLEKRAAKRKAAKKKTVKKKK